MKFIVELLAYGKDGEVREVEVGVEAGNSNTKHLLGLIYRWGQNEVQPKDQPSVSVGDVIRLRRRRYLILPVGYKHLPKADYERYKAIPMDQRAVRCYLDNAISKL